MQNHNNVMHFGPQSMDSVKTNMAEVIHNGNRPLNLYPIEEQEKIDNKPKTLFAGEGAD